MQISRKWFEIEAKEKWHMADRKMTSLMTSRDLERSRSWPQYL